MFQSHFANLRSGSFSESVWSREFYRVATALLPAKYVISPEVRSITGAKSQTAGSLDYYVNGELQWLIEFLVGGSRLVGHVKRFELNGIYNALPVKDSIVVDFHLAPKKKVQQRFKAKVMRVTLAEDFKSAVIEDKDQESEVKLLGNQVKRWRTFEVSLHNSF